MKKIFFNPTVKRGKAYHSLRPEEVSENSIFHIIHDLPKYPENSLQNPNNLLHHA